MMRTSAYVTVLVISTVSAVYNPIKYPPIKPPVDPVVDYCNPNWKPVPCPRIPLRHECDRNQDCRKLFETCCKDDCGNRICKATKPTKPPVQPIRYCNANWRPVPCASILPRHECDRNQDCRKLFETCCKDDCGNRICKATIPTKPPVHPIRYCNAKWRPVPCPRIALIHKCYRNQDCGPLEKCCKDDCGNNVCRPIGIIPTKPPVHPIKYCKANWRPVPCPKIALRHECDSNQDCSPREKCCKDDCGNRICKRRGTIPTPPVGRCPNDRSGLCLRKHVGKHQCKRDIDCGRNRICCVTGCGRRVCRRKASLPACRSNRRNVLCHFIRPINHQCQSDSDCSIGRTCCRNSCGRQICQKNTKVPSCPKPRLHINRICARGRDLCHRNSDCSPNEICCKNGCNYNICRRKTEKPGRCPVSFGPRPLILCRPRLIPRCENDYDCKGSKKCCSDFCGDRICSNPVNVVW